MNRNKNIMIMLPLTAVGFGLPGLLLRYIERSTVFDDNGLAAPGAGISIALIVLCVLFAALTLSILIRIGKVSEKGSYAEIFSPGGTTFLLRLVSGALLALAAVLYAVSSGGTAALVMALASAAAGVCLIMLSLSLKKSGSGGAMIFSAGILMFHCLFLILVYREHSADPELLNYAYKVLALVFTVLGSYYCSGIAFGRTHMKRAVFCCSAAVFFLLVIMADAHTLAVRTVMISAILLMLSQLLELLAWVQKSGRSC